MTDCSSQWYSNWAKFEMSGTEEKVTRLQAVPDFEARQLLGIKGYSKLLYPR